MFSDSELKTVRKLNTPFELQEYLNELEYNAGKRFSVSDVLKLKKGDCMEAAVLAVLVLKHHGYDSFLVDLEAVRDEDHVLAVYRYNGLYGAVAQSKFLNLRERMPVYSSLRELVMSYFDNYFNFFGEYALRKRSAPVRVEPFLRKHGVGDVKLVTEIEKHLFKVKHQRLLGEMKLPRVSYKKFWSEVDITPSYVKIGKKYARK